MTLVFKKHAAGYISPFSLTCNLSCPALQSKPLKLSKFFIVISESEKILLVSSKYSYLKTMAMHSIIILFNSCFYFFRVVIRLSKNVYV